MCILMTRRYTAVAEIQVQKPNSDSLTLDSNAASPAGGDTDPNSASMNLETQATVLESPALAMKVIEDLHLEDTSAFKPHFTFTGWVNSLFSPPPPADPAGVALSAAPLRRDRLLKQFQENLEVKIIPGTRVIEVAFSSSDPNLAARVVNQLVASLVNYSFQSRRTVDTEASKFLESQLAEMKADSDALEQKAVKLQKQTGVVQVAGSGDGDGQGQAYSSTLDQLQKATAAVSQAHTNVILKGAIYEVVKSGDPETIMGLPSNTALAGAASGMSNDLAVISSLRTREATLNGQINELLAKFGPAYPKVDELKADLTAIQNSIKEEIQRMRDRARNEYVVAQQVESGAKQLYDAEKQRADEMNDKAVQYSMARQQADQSRSLYEKLQSRMKEAGVLEGFHSSNITVVSPALAPSAPSRPNIPLYLAGSLATGLLFGCIMAVVVDLMDSKIADIHGLESLMGEAPFGILPSFAAKKKGLRLSGHSFALPGREAIAALKDPHSAYVEALRALRTTLLSTRGGAPPQVLLVTSSTEGEGKSTLSSNLAVVLAQQGKRVLLVDADLRRPNLHVLFNSSLEVGLSTILAGQLSVDAMGQAFLQVEAVPGLDILLSGPIPAYSAELLGSSKMRQLLDLWRGYYDFIILDGAPVLPVTDSVVLSSQVDATLLVARYQSTQQQSLDLSLRTLRAQLGTNRHIGVVLNGVERTADAYYKYYGFSNSTYYTNTKRLGGGSEIS
ncbi:Tyrosine-protein kinase Wzc [Acidisarcina polymorpha]|uniref:Tyrosine-protein kinase Wzc n=1 Tax=Acidisarcina polymorpha TaxID=2211140 RepID=A0A2Z5FVL3_9BACT|nr:Tyrosine-protein kinase Wzc [Acidisarcina polymorpha]